VIAACAAFTRSASTRRLEEADDQVARILLRLRLQRIGVDRLSELGRRAHVVVAGQTQPFRGLRFEQGLEFGGRLLGAAEHDVPALEQRLRVLESELCDHLAQIRHRDHLVAADVHAAQ
jgi:hypothetical protein